MNATKTAGVLMALVFGSLFALPSAAQELNLSGMQLWNLDRWQTLRQGDFIGPNYEFKKLKPITLAGCRNGHFSGAVAVTCSTAPIPNLKVTITDLVCSNNGARIPTSAIRLRYPDLVKPDNSSGCPDYWFDRFADTLPDEIPMVDMKEHSGWKPKNKGPVATQPIWVTVDVPSNAVPGDYEGKLTIVSDLNKVPVIPVKIKVADWAVPDPKNFRVTIFGQESPESICRYYEIPRWSDKHYELMSKSFKLMAEINSRQAILDLCIDFYGLGGVPETMVKWIKQPDGTYKYDYTSMDKYMDMVQKAIGKPTLLRVNTWPEWNLSFMNRESKSVGWTPAAQVSLLDPASGSITLLDQPPADSPDFVPFWKPVLAEVRKKIEARGWYDVTAFGINTYMWGVHPKVVDAAYAIWPDAKWSYTAHNGCVGGRFFGTDKSISMPTLHMDVIWGQGKLETRGYQVLLQPRANYWCYTFRNWWPWWDLIQQRSVLEQEILKGHDGVSDFGADFFPVADERGRRYTLGCGRGRGTGGPHESTLALLSPGPEGPTTNPRFEAIREGVQISEAMLFIQRILDSGKAPPELAARANAVLDERGKRMQDAYVLADKAGRTRFDCGISFDTAETRENELFAVAAEMAKAEKTGVPTPVLRALTCMGK